MPRIRHPCCNLVGQPLIVCVLCLLIDSVFSLQLQIWLLKKDHNGNLNHQENKHQRNVFQLEGGLSSQKSKLVVVRNWVYTNAMVSNTNPQAPVFERFQTTMKKHTDLLVPPVPSWRSHGMWKFWLQGGNKAWNSSAQARTEGKLLDD